MWDRWALRVPGTRLGRLSNACAIYGMDIRVSRYGGGLRLRGPAPSRPVSR